METSQTALPNPPGLFSPSSSPQQPITKPAPPLQIASPFPDLLHSILLQQLQPLDHNSLFSLSVTGARDEPSGDPSSLLTSPQQQRFLPHQQPKQAPSPAPPPRTAVPAAAGHNTAPKPPFPFSTVRLLSIIVGDREAIPAAEPAPISPTSNRSPQHRHRSPHN